MSLLYTYITLVWLCILGAAFFMGLEWLNRIESGISILSNAAVGAAAIFGMIKYNDWKEEFGHRERYKAAKNLSEKYVRLYECVSYSAEYWGEDANPDVTRGIETIRAYLHELKITHKTSLGIIRYEDSIVERLIRHVEDVLSVAEKKSWSHVHMQMLQEKLTTNNYWREDKLLLMANLKSYLYLDK